MCSLRSPEPSTTRGGAATRPARVRPNAASMPRGGRRVLRVLDELDYTPNNLARNLRARALRVFGLVIPDIRNAVYTSLHRGVEDVARASGFFVLLANTDEHADRQTEYLRMLVAERV